MKLVTLPALFMLGCISASAQGKVIQGDSQFGKVVAILDGDKLISGDSRFGTVIGRIDGDKVVRGDSKFGTVIARIDGDKIIMGDSKVGKVIGRVKDGGGASGAAGAVFLLLM